jgi:hypothetical protein
MSDSHTYTWNGSASDDWATAANWTDVATQATAQVAPGSQDVAIVGNIGTVATLSRDGDAASLTFLGNSTVLGYLDGVRVDAATGTGDVLVFTLRDTPADSPKCRKTAPRCWRRWRRSAIVRPGP